MFNLRRLQRPRLPVHCGNTINHFSRLETCKYAEHTEKSRLPRRPAERIVSGSTTHPLINSLTHCRIDPSFTRVTRLGHTHAREVEKPQTSNRPLQAWPGKIHLPPYLSSPPIVLHCFALRPFWQKEAGLQPKTSDRKSHYLFHTHILHHSMTPGYFFQVRSS